MTTVVYVHCEGEAILAHIRKKKGRKKYDCIKLYMTFIFNNKKAIKFVSTKNKLWYFALPKEVKV